MKNSKQLERHFKGIANHWRISALILLSENKSLSLHRIAETLGANFYTMAEHLNRLDKAGLINKKYKGREVHHSLSPYGKKFQAFIKLAQKL